MIRHLFAWADRRELSVQDTKLFLCKIALLLSTAALLPEVLHPGMMQRLEMFWMHGVVVQ